MIEWRYYAPFRLAGSKGWGAAAEQLCDGMPIPLGYPVSRHGTVMVFQRGKTPCEALRKVREFTK